MAQSASGSSWFDAHLPGTVELINSPRFQPVGLALWALAAVFFLCAPFLFFHSAGVATQALDAQVAAAAQSELAPVIRQRSIPKPMIATVKDLLQRENLGLNYITLRNADRVILISDGQFEDSWGWLPAKQARQWRSTLYHASSYDRALAIRKSGEIVGYISYGIATSHVLAALPWRTWLIILLDVLALAVLFALLPVVMRVVQPRLAASGSAKAAPKPRPARSKSRAAQAPAEELQLSDRLGIGFVSIDQQGIVARANTNAARLLGFELRALVGQNLESLMVLEDAQGVSLDTPLQRCMQGERRPVRTQAWLRRRDGKLLGLELHAGVTPADANAAASMLFWEASDEMTARHENSERAALAQTLLKHTHEAVLLADKAGRVLHANAQAARLFDYSGEQMNTLSLAKLLPQPFAQNPGVALQAGAGDAVRSDGTTTAVSFSSVTLRWQNKPANLVIVRVSDAQGAAAVTSVSAQAAPDALPALAYHDPLTGLASRRHLMQQLANRFDVGSTVKPCLLLFVDIDDFKRINHDFGRAVGDQVLAAFGQQLSTALEEGDIAARLGGEEFAILLCGEKLDEHIAASQAQTLLQTCQQPLQIGKLQLHLRVHIGMSAAPLDANSPEELLQHAEAALYAGKASDAVDPVLYAPGMALRVADTQAARALHQALASDSLSLKLQAICHASEGNPIAAGLAVLSWQDPDQQCIENDALWRAAQDAGLAQALAAWCLRGLVQIQVGWRDMGFPPVPLCMPLPPALLQSEDLARLCATLMTRYDLGDDALIFSLSDIAAQTPPPGVRSAQLMPSGKLEQTSADILELPAAVVAGLPDQPEAIAQAKALGAFGRKHGKWVWAGPVETQAQRSALIAMDISLMYGPLIAQPLAPRPFARYMAQHKTRAI